MPALNEQYEGTLLDRADRIALVANNDLTNYLGRVGINIDMVTIYPQDESDRKRLNIEAEEIGKKIFSMGGSIYELNEPLDNGTSAIKVARKTDSVDTLGCVDFDTKGYYLQIRNILFKGETLLSERVGVRIRAWHDSRDFVEYSTLKIEEPESAVVLNFPSVRITDAIRRISEKASKE